EYERHADVWPLNPEGDLLAIAMIETAEGLRNVNEIASVPGVGAIFLGAGGDLHQYLGVPQDAPEVEQARQTILAACKAHNVPCGITALTKADVDKRLKEGWKMIRTGRGEKSLPNGFGARILHTSPRHALANLLGPTKIVLLERQGTNPLPRCSEDCIANRGSTPSDDFLADSGNRVVCRSDKLHLYLGHFCSPQQRIRIKIALRNAALLDRDFLPKHCGQPHR